MQQEAAQELIARQSGELLLVCGIAPAEGHLAIGKRYEPMVGDGHTMRVAAEIVQHILGTIFLAQRSTASNEGASASN